MTYIENIFICLSAPLFIGALCVGKKYHHAFLFVIAGYAACLISSYVNTFFAKAYSADVIAASVEISPVVEEIAKLLPVLFYLLVFEPARKNVLLAIFAVGTGFATLENTFYLVQGGADQLVYLLIRGLGTGSMHIVCGAIVGYGLLYIWSYPWLKLSGTFGLLCAAITYHAVYNLLITAGGFFEIIGFSLPLFTVGMGIAVTKRRRLAILKTGR